MCGVHAVRQRPGRLSGSGRSRSSRDIRKNFLEAVIMGNKAHQPGGKVRTLESFCSETMSKLAKVRYGWCGVAEHDTALKWVSR